MSAKLGNGTVTFGDSTVQSTAATASFPSPGYALFTASGTSSWTCPTGVNRVLVLVIGGGGGSMPQRAYGGNVRGGVGGHAACIFDVTPSSSYSYTVGQGGTASQATSGSVTAGTGGTSSFNSVLSATGGSGVSSISNTLYQGGDAGLGTNSSNSTNVNFAYLPWGSSTGSNSNYSPAFCAPANGIGVTTGSNPWTGVLVYVDNSGPPGSTGYIVPGAGAASYYDSGLNPVGTVGCNGIVYIQYIG